MSAQSRPLRSPRPGLPPVPPRMQLLPIEERGYPVPWFVQWVDGKPDFRVMDRRKWGLAVRFGNCWLCGEPCGVLRTFVIGPMCGVNRTTSEPPCHEECAEFAATACPFMTLPKSGYRHGDYDETQQPAGMPIFRNPGVTCLWTTREFSVFRTGGLEGPGNPGRLIHLGDPRKVRWFAQGRKATRAEVLTSIDGGIPFLRREAQAQSQDAVDALDRMLLEFQRYLPA
jgi:hypothetical protein